MSVRLEEVEVVQEAEEDLVQSMAVVVLLLLGDEYKWEGNDCVYIEKCGMQKSGSRIYAKCP